MHLMRKWLEVGNHERKRAAAEDRRQAGVWRRGCVAARHMKEWAHWYNDDIGESQDKYYCELLCFYCWGLEWEEIRLEFLEFRRELLCCGKEGLLFKGTYFWFEPKEIFCIVSGLQRFQSVTLIVPMNPCVRFFLQWCCCAPSRDSSTTWLSNFRCLFHRTPVHHSFVVLAGPQTSTFRCALRII